MPAAKPVHPTPAPAVLVSASEGFDPMIGPLQARVMHFIWSGGPATVHDVHSALNEKADKQLAYTTILTVMRNLARRKVLSQVPNGRTHVFSALITKEELQKQVVKYVATTYFEGDTARMKRAVA